MSTFRLGIFIVATLTILGAAVFLIGNNQMRFHSTFHVRADFRNVSGLVNGADVRVGGVHMGTVRRINLPGRPDGPVDVEIDLESKTRNLVKKDSVAAIRSEGLLGDKYVEVSFGSPDSPGLRDGDIIQSEPPLEFSELVKKTDQILDSAKATMQKFGATTENLESISAKINSGKGTAGALVNDKKMYQAATAAATSFQEDAEALKHNFLLRGFFKKRGYEDSVDLKKDEISGLPREAFLKSFSYDASKTFDKADTAKLKNHKMLDEAGRFLEENRFGLTVVAVSSGMRGDTDKERTLTQARAMVVREYLIKNFKLDDTRVKTLGLGKEADAGDAGKVEILVYASGATRTQSGREQASQAPEGPK